MAPESVAAPPAASAPAPAPVAAPPAAQHGQAQRPQRPSLLSGSININVAPPAPTAVPKVAADVEPLTQEALERYWTEVADELDLQELLRDGQVRLGEKPGLIEVDAQTTWFHDDFRQHKLDVLTALRNKCGMPMLECKVNPLFVKKNDVLYSPDQKYNAMLERNPAIAGLRKLFPNIDY